MDSSRHERSGSQTDTTEQDGPLVARLHTRIRKLEQTVEDLRKSRAFAGLMSLDEVAGALRISIPTLRTLRELPDFPTPVKLGSRLRYMAADIEAYCKKRSRSAS